MRRVLLLALAIAVVAAIHQLARRPRGEVRPHPDFPGAERPRSQAVVINVDSIRMVRQRVLRIIADSDTYLAAMLAEGDSALKRWPERVDRPLRVYVPEGGAPGYSVALAQAVQNAFNRWPRTGGVPVHFQFVRDSAHADVHVRWIDRFPGSRTGQADVEWNQAGWMVGATLTLATHTNTGWLLSPDAVYTVSLHEIGHLLGLGHSDDPADVMYPSTAVHDLTLRDIRTAGLLYALPPGSLRESSTTR